MKIADYEFRFTPLKILALSLAGAIALLNIIVNSLMMSSFNPARFNAAYFFSMLGGLIFAFICGLVIWLVSDVMEGRYINKTKPATDKPKEITEPIKKESQDKEEN